MKETTRIMRYVLLDVMRNRWVIAYALFFFLSTDVLLRLGGTGGRAIVSLLNIVLILVPLVTVVFGTMYWHGAREFNELLLTQPVKRSTLFHGLFAGLVVPLSLAFIAGVSVPFLWHGAIVPEFAGMLLLLLAAGVALTAIFGALAILVAGLVEDRLRGLAIALGVWLLLTVVYDGMVLWITMAFRDVPLVQPLLVLTFANPVDLARVMLLLQLDAASLLGASGAAFHGAMANEAGLVAALAGLTIWAVVPGLLALRAFRNRDF